MPRFSAPDADRLAGDPRFAQMPCRVSADRWALAREWAGDVVGLVSLVVILGGGLVAAAVWG